MFLVHAVLRSPPPASLVLPSETSGWVWCCAGVGDRIEHVTLHPTACPDPVVGLYFSTRGLLEAERRATTLVRRTLRRHRELVGWTLVRAHAPLVRPELVWGRSLDR